MTANLEELPSQVRDLVERAAHGQEIVITHKDKPIARIVAIPPAVENAPFDLDTILPAQYMGLKGPLPSRSEIAEEMYDRHERG